ncbi:MAG: glycosyltransferase, partial [Pseudomonadota bacterium]
RAARQSGVPFVTTYHGAYSEKNRLKKAYNAVMARGDIVIANSQFTANLIRERYNIDEDRLVVIPRGVDLERFNRDAISDERIGALRDAWGVTARDRIILLPARLTRLKGHRVAIDAFSRLPNRIRDAALLVAVGRCPTGSQKLRTELEAQICGSGLTDRVKLLEHCGDMPAAMCAASVVLIATTTAETFGRTSVEAQAVGTPVIATAIGGPMETVIPWNGKRGIGWLVPPGDADALANAIAESLATGSQDRLTLTRDSIANARHNFTTERLKTATLTVYRSRLAPLLATATKTAEERTGSLSSPSQRMTDSTANAA